MVEIIEPNAPTITIKLMRNGSMAFNGPEDKLLSLGMLSIAMALVQKEIIGGASSLSGMPTNGRTA